MSFIIFPLTIINVPRSMNKFALAIGLIRFPVALITCPIWPSLNTIALSFVANPFSFVLYSIFEYFKLSFLWLSGVRLVVQILLISFLFDVIFIEILTVLQFDKSFGRLANWLIILIIDMNLILVRDKFFRFRLVSFSNCIDLVSAIVSYFITNSTLVTHYNNLSILNINNGKTFYKSSDTVLNSASFLHLLHFHQHFSVIL